MGRGVPLQASKSEHGWMGEDRRGNRGLHLRVHDNIGGCVSHTLADVRLQSIPVSLKTVSDQQRSLMTDADILRVGELMHL